MKNRKIPFAFFVFGVVQCLIRYFLIGVVGLACLLIGMLTHSGAVQFGFCMILLWILLSILDEIRICHTIRKENSRSDLNEIYDKLFGEEELMKKVLDEGKDASMDIMKELLNNKKGDDKNEK
ncbi:MAG: hypothetical protein NC124_04765 [Clostridium sp.]|nr:hypothetical protein [Clostridium sp.]